MIKNIQIEYSYPLLNEPIDERWSNIAALALPDGAHNRENDLIYFHLPSLNDEDDYHQTTFGVASYRQIDAQVCFILFFIYFILFVNLECNK